MKLFIIFIIITSFSFKVSGQYKLNVKKYDVRDYAYNKSDPNNPLICGAASYFMPGLGQMIAGETNRGLIFTGAFAGSLATTFVGLLKSPDLNNNVPNNSPGNAILITGISSMIVTWVWSIADAVKVAKINNLAYRDTKKTSYSFNIQPGIMTNNFSNTPVIGLNLKLKL